MRKVLLAMAGVLAATPAMAQFGAQYQTRPTIYGQPQFGYTTTGPNGSQYQTTPNIYGHPEFGTQTNGPGVHCTTTPTMYGHPEMGYSTSCH